METRSRHARFGGFLRLEKAAEMKVFGQALIILFTLAIVAVFVGSKHTSPLITATANLITALTKMVNGNGTT